MATRAVTYGRQSVEREARDASPRAQKASTAALVAAKGWQHAGHYQDVGISGYDPKAVRPGFDALLAAVGRREADVVVVWKLDRLTRQGVAEAVRIVGFLRDHGAALVSVQEQFLDTTTPMGVGVFALFAAMAEQESANISTRVRAVKESLRRAGSFSGGQTPYGFAQVSELHGATKVVRLRRMPHEAAIMEEVAERVLAGESIRSLAADLNRRGVPTKTGAGTGEWTTGRLSRLLRDPRLAGWASSGPDDAREVLRDDDGEPIFVGDAIVGATEWYRLQETIAGRRGGRGPRANPALLSPLLICASCGSGAGADRRPDGRATYRCRRARQRGTCYEGFAVAVAQTDDWVARTVWGRVATLDPADESDGALLEAASERFAATAVDTETEGERQAAAAAIADAERAIQSLDEGLVAGSFAGPTGAARHARLVETQERRLAAGRERLASADARRAEPGLPWLDVAQTFDDPDENPLGPGTPWAAWSVEKRRAFLSTFLDAVIVTKGEGRQGGNSQRWRGHERLRFVWADDTRARHD